LSRRFAHELQYETLTGSGLSPEYGWDMALGVRLPDLWHFCHDTEQRAGATPSITFGHGTVCKLVVPLWAMGSCPIAKVTARVTHLVISVFHAHFTFPRCK